MALMGAILSVQAARGTDWTSWRGVGDRGMAYEKALVSEWSLEGEHLLWKAPYGGRSTPILVDGLLYLNGPVGEGEMRAERVVCLQADTGRPLWEYRFNVFLTDIAENRVGWTAMVADPETGNIYCHGTGGELLCLSRIGQVVWRVSTTEDLGRISGYGGRLHNPILDEDRVILTFSNSSWGDQAKPSHRLAAFDKRDGRVLWWSEPGESPPEDPTCYATPVAAIVGGTRMIIAPNGDGSVYAVGARTGEKLWSFPFCKRGLNVSPVVDGDRVYVSHSEENLHSTEMGSVACLDASQRGVLSESAVVWRRDGIRAGYASPSIADGRVYVVDNSATLHCLDARDGRSIWEFDLGRVGKGSPVVTADGVIYVAEQNGIFWILRDEGERCVELDRELFRREDRLVDEIFGSPAVCDGRVYFITRYGTYALGKAGAAVERVPSPAPPAEVTPTRASPTFLHVVPAEVTLAPGAEARFEPRFFVGETPAPGVLQAKCEWSVTGVAGQVSQDGTFTAAATTKPSAGFITARGAGLEAKARVRVFPAPPIREDFEGLAEGSIPPGWAGIAAKTKVVARDGGKVLVKLAERPSVPFVRIRGYIGPPVAGGYTISAEMLGEGLERGPVKYQADMGLINSRYRLILLGNDQVLRLESWAPLPRIRRDVPFAWAGERWYVMKLRIEVEGNRSVCRGKVWPRGEPEPTDWTIEVMDPSPNAEGSPGIYAYSPGTTPSSHGPQAFFDNIEVIRNDE